ncbi:hypothetical protein [Streptomyces marianii]|uniref:Uncharacterized protein n=1 Tax=Streptomyces marianii TaxID=1817406 RepID=A0A5R9EC01_9ACTN|nr:hypothetical protein [Streptomyces marianii]TLQ47720.1 hypothetical protein FEF34_36585 [Streptomyces marianii]
MDFKKVPARVQVADEDGTPAMNSDGSAATVPFPGADDAPGRNKRAPSDEAQRSVTVDDDGRVVETAVVPLKRPLP